MGDRGSVRFWEQETFWGHMAPLSKVFARHLFAYLERSAEETTRLANPAAFERAFYARFVAARQKVFLQIAGLEDGVTTELFLEALRQESPDQVPVQAQTLSGWTKARLVRKGFNRVETHSFAELLLMRMLDRRQKGWLPSSVPQNEPQMWVFYQAPATLFVDGEWVEQPVQILPYPIPADVRLAASGLLWSPWEGLALDGWMHVEGLGACRFVGQKVWLRQKVWNVTLADLERWGAIPDIELGTSEEAIQNLAQRTLLVLSARKLSLPEGFEGMAAEEQRES
jgi:hypothetical protein